jgi:hypothetical protein
VLSVNQSQINPTHQERGVDVPDNDCSVMKIAVHVIRLLGLIFLAAGIGCAIAATQTIPTIAFFVASAAALILGFILDKSEEKTSAPPSAIVFGKEEWMRLIGRETGRVPPLPDNIQAILDAPCPFWPDKTVAQTHMLVLIPKTFTHMNNGNVVREWLTLNTLNQVVKSKQGAGIGHFPHPITRQYVNTQIDESYWVLMTKNVLPESEGKTYPIQKALVEAAGYEVPGCLEAATCILLEELRSGTRLFGIDPLTYTCCEENIDGSQLLVGGFDPRGLMLHSNFYHNVPNGIAGVKRF